MIGYDNDQYKVAKSVSDISVNFYSFGLALGLKPSALDKIRSENPDTSAALQEVIKKWLSRVSLTSDAQSIEPSWRILVIAVDAETGGGNPALAKTIADAHPGRLCMNFTCFPGDAIRWV